MIGLHSLIKKRVAFPKSGLPLFFGRRHRQTRRAQTLVEYALIMAYISVVSMQAMSYLGFIAQKQYVYVNCVTIVANTNNQNVPTATNQANEMTAVSNYVSASSTWRNYPSTWSGPAATAIYNQVYNIVYSN